MRIFLLVSLLYFSSPTGPLMKAISSANAEIYCLSFINLFLYHSYRWYKSFFLSFLHLNVNIVIFSNITSRRKKKWSGKITNQQVLKLVNNILRTKVSGIGHILRRNRRFHHDTEGQITEVKGVGKRRIRTQLLDDLRNRRRYWELKQEAEDRNRWRRQFINRT